MNAIVISAYGLYFYCVCGNYNFSDKKELEKCEKHTHQRVEKVHKSNYLFVLIHYMRNAWNANNNNNKNVFKYDIFLPNIGRYIDLCYGVELVRIWCDGVFDDKYA